MNGDDDQAGRDAWDRHQDRQWEHRSAGPRRRTELRRRSNRTEAEHRKYVRFVAGLAAESTICEVGPRISAVDHSYRGCTNHMGGLHHLKKRSAGGALMDPANVLRSCNVCNTWCEDNPHLAQQAGLVIRG